MSSVHLSDIRRTTSFRLAVLFLAVFGAAGAMLIGYLYWQTAGYLSSRVDAALAEQTARWSQFDAEKLLRELNGHTARDPATREPYGLFSATGRSVAGAIDSIRLVREFDRPFDFSLNGPDGKPQPLRGMAHVLDDGRVLLLTCDVSSVREFDDLMVRAIASGAALILVMGLLGAVALGFGAKRRIDAITRSIERIVDGHLSERLPLGGSNDDVDHLAVLVNRMLDEIERLMGEVKGVCDDVAHDLRTPLTRLLAGLERAERGGLGVQEYSELIRNASEEARALLRTFRALLRVSEIENGARRAGFTTVDLSRVAADVVEFYEPVAEERQVTLSITAPAGPVWLQGDAQLLFEAVSNLVDNALKFTPTGGRVAVQASRAEDEVSIVVRDNGSGIALDEREAVFRRFYRSEKSRHAPGNGLGLSLVAAVAKLHKLTVELHDAEPGCEVVMRGEA